MDPFGILSFTDVCADGGLHTDFREYADGCNGSYDRRVDHGSVNCRRVSHDDDDG